jgi:FkbM family methyltransferase
VKRVQLPLTAKLLRLWLRSGIRGANRASRMLAQRMVLLRAVPIEIADWPPVYMDLRDWGAQDWLRDSPWPACPREPEEQDIMRRFVRNGDVVYDIGANVGLHSSLLSRLVGETGHVYMFEPNPALSGQLEKTAAHMGNGTLFTAALSNEEGDATLFVAEGDNSLSSLANWTAGRFETTAVKCTRTSLDRLVEVNRLPVPNFIKCDVEGAELDVFEGAKHLLNRVDAPILLFEANIHNSAGFGRSVWSAKKYLEELEAPKYAFFEAADGSGVRRLTQLNPVHSNILAVPHSVLRDWPELAD